MVAFPILSRLMPLDTPEKEQVYNWALHCLTMLLRNPGSRLWKMRAKRALLVMEEIWGRGVE